MRKIGFIIVIATVFFAAVGSCVSANAKWDAKIGDFFRKAKEYQDAKDEAEREKYMTEYGGAKGVDGLRVCDIDGASTYPGLVGSDNSYSPLSGFKSMNEDPDPASSSKLKDYYGNSYSSAYVNSNGHCCFKYNTGGKYKTFVGTLYIPEDVTDDNDTGRLSVKVGGKEVYLSEVISIESRPIKIYVDISNADVVEINLPWYIPCCLANAGFSTSAMRSINFGDSGSPVSLESLKSIGQPLCQTSFCKDNYGHVFPKVFANMNSHTDMAYILDGKYSTFCAVIFIPQNTDDSDTGKFSVEADGQTIVEIPNVNQSMRTFYIEVPIRGCNSFKIHMPWYIPCYMTAACLY